MTLFPLLVLLPLLPTRSICRVTGGSSYNRKQNRWIFANDLVWSQKGSTPIIDEAMVDTVGKIIDESYVAHRGKSVVIQNLEGSGDGTGNFEQGKKKLHTESVLTHGFRGKIAPAEGGHSSEIKRRHSVSSRNLIGESASKPEWPDDDDIVLDADKQVDESLKDSDFTNSNVGGYSSPTIMSEATTYQAGAGVTFQTESQMGSHDQLATGDGGEESPSATSETFVEGGITDGSNEGEFVTEAKDGSPIGSPSDNIDEFSAEHYESVEGSPPMSSYHRNEFDNEEEEEGKGGKTSSSDAEEDQSQAVQGHGSEEIESNANNVTEKSSTATEGYTNNEGNPEDQNCQPAKSCIECLNLSIEHLRGNSNPCYWIVVDFTANCVAETGGIGSGNNGPPDAYSCSEENTAVYTGESWDAALKAMMGQDSMSEDGGEKIMSSSQNHSSPPINQNQSEGYYHDDEEEGFLDMVESTFKVILLAVFLSSILMIRKRVINRLRDDPSLETAGVVKEEVLNCVISIGSSIANKIFGSRDGNDRHNSSTRTNSSTLGRSGSLPNQREIIPLSTATDEEWGWDDDDTRPNLELAGVGANGIDEEEDLALAIAMSLSESTKEKTIQSSRNSTSKPAITKMMAPAQNQSKIKDQGAPIVVSTVRKSSMSTESTSSQPSGNSIEDLLGQMNSTGGPVITTFGQKPKVVPSKTKNVAKEEDSDDIFASMGLSSKASKPMAPRSAPLPSLAADNNADADWGDDGDLDDLLDD